MLTKLLGEMLLEDDHIEQQDLNSALEIQKSVGGKLGSILVRIGAISEDGLLSTLSKQLEMPLLNGDALPLGFERYKYTIERSGIPLDWWLDQEVLAWEMPEGGIRCIARDPLNDTIAEVFARVFPGQVIEWCLMRNHDLERTLDQLARAETASSPADFSAAHLRELAEEAPVIEFVNNLMSQASDQRASDIHVEPDEHSFAVRFRIDGVLYTRFTLPKERFSAIASRIKLISGMDIAERRLPQDGRLGARVSGEEIDIRVSAVPGVHGESIVLRLLPKERQEYQLDRLGLENDHYRLLRRWIEEPHGILLVTGPTGSGKSTTLYAALEAINDRKRKIITVEDPVEYQLNGITQIQTLSDIDYTFARALRSILRQDPDVIMVGEIRDRETAEIAIQASLTGHLVLSTLHTNDAVSAFTRLIDMDVEPFLVATPIRAVMAQRLVRRLCPSCAVPTTPVAEIVELTNQILSADEQAKGPRWRQPEGCPACQGTGYSGRLGIYELVGVTPEMQSLIVHEGSATEMRTLAKKQGYRTLREDGLLKAYRGITSVEEVLRVSSD